MVNRPQRLPPKPWVVLWPPFNTSPAEVAIAFREIGGRRVPTEAMCVELVAQLATDDGRTVAILALREWYRTVLAQKLCFLPRVVLMAFIAQILEKINLLPNMNQFPTMRF